MPEQPLTLERLHALPPMLDLTTAAGLLGIGRTTAYRLARAGTWPCRLIRIGTTYRVPTRDLLALLGITPTDTP